MFENPHPKSQDNTVVELSEDQLAVIEREGKELVGCLSNLKILLDGNKLTVSSRYNIAYLMKKCAAKLIETTGEETDIDQEQELMFAKLRLKNEEIRNLKELVGKSRGLDGVPESLRLASKNFQEFWSAIGFCGVIDHPMINSSTGHGQHGGFAPFRKSLCYEAHLWVRLNEMGYLFPSDTPVSDGEKHEKYLENMKNALDLEDEEKMNRAMYFHVLDTEKNRAYIEGNLRAKYPSLTIENIMVVSQQPTAKAGGLVIPTLSNF